LNSLSIRWAVLFCDLSIAAASGVVVFVSMELAKMVGRER
jgi:hypothetical protein